VPGGMDPGNWSLVSRCECGQVLNIQPIEDIRSLAAHQYRCHRFCEFGLQIGGEGRGWFVQGADGVYGGRVELRGRRAVVGARNELRHASQPRRSLSQNANGNRFESEGKSARGAEESEHVGVELIDHFNLAASPIQVLHARHPRLNRLYLPSDNLLHLHPKTHRQNLHDHPKPYSQSHLPLEVGTFGCSELADMSSDSPCQTSMKTRPAITRHARTQTPPAYPRTPS